MKKKNLLLIPTVAIFGILLYRSLTGPDTNAFDVAMLPVAESREKPVFSSRLASRGKTAEVHSATMVELPDGRIRAFWYGGSREGARDVAIYSAVYEPDTKQWSEEDSLITRKITQDATRRYIKKLGNPVAYRDNQGTLWLFFVSTSIGGWSTSAINLTTSKDEGLTWTAPKRLITSPFFNLSTLVKAPPLILNNGMIGLPAYHELAGKFGELVIVDRNGGVIGKRRLSSGRLAIQPVIVPISATRAVGFMRNSSQASRRVIATASENGGENWATPYATSLPNPDAAIAVERISEKELIIVFNDDEEERHNLAIAYSRDLGTTWSIVAQLKDELADGESVDAVYSYPALLQTKKGDFHLLFSWKESHIRHIYFNRAWLNHLIPST